MRTCLARLAGALLALFLNVRSGWPAQSKITLAGRGGACLCYLPTVLARDARATLQRRGLRSNCRLEGAPTRLNACSGGSADVVSGYFDPAVISPPRSSLLQSFVV